MQENNLIKSITSSNCPHCKNEIFIESVMTPPNINSVFSKKDIEEAKKDCLARIETLAIDDNKKESVIKWINDPEIVFGPGEVENIILSLLEQKKE
jgi:hypothetical protein